MTVALLIAGCNSATKTAAQAPGELIGTVELSQDVPATGCRVVLEGTPLGGACDETGTFDIKKVPPGRWDLRIITDGAANALPARRVAAAANSSQISDIGAVVLAKPGAIGGHVRNPAGNLGLDILAVPEVGAVAAPNDNGGFLLENVSPGLHEVVLITDNGTVIRSDVNVLPAKVTVGADFDLATAAAGMVSVSGFARRADQPDGGHGGITVDAIEDLNGGALASATTASDGSFSLSVAQGTYILRAHDGANPISAIAPSLVMKGSSFQLATVLSIQPADGDLDGDGVPNDKDPDIDGDGYLNMMDAFPYDPAEWKDTDGDGVGDRADLRSMGGAGVDNHTPTPDSDGDGLLDFEDNCPKDANPDQWDPDGDGVGTLHNMQSRCDNCPFVPNPDQKDSVGNGVGDACRNCHQNADCGAGQICEFGMCVQCNSNAQCGLLVCRAGKCVKCAQSSDCSGGSVCSPAGACVQCVTNADCATNQQCVTNQCFSQCASDASCPGGFCVSGVCAACRGNADCPTTQYCAAGACHPQCTTNGDCAGAQICDPATHTCVMPCSAMCPSGQACDASNVCRPLCDASRPCATGFKCNAMSLCVPQCATNADCTAAHTVCSAGQCVSDGTCTLDADCTVDKMCIGGQCTTRPTSLVAGKGYACTKPCDCRMGEACLVNASDGMSYCASDAVPTKFIVPMGTGNGLSPLTPASSSVAIADGDVIVARAGDNFSFSSPIDVSHQHVTLNGGYAVCGPNRWVRDPSQRTTIASSATAVTAQGTPSAPLAGLVIRNWVLDATSPVGVRNLDVNWAPGVVIDRVTFGFTATTGGNARWGLYLQNASGAMLTNLDTPGVTDGGAGTYLEVLHLDHVDGTVDHFHSGPLTMISIGYGLYATNTTGPLTISNAQIDRDDMQSGAGLHVQNGAGGLVTFTNNQLAFDVTTAPNASWAGIELKNTPAYSITNNTIDGRGLSNNAGETSIDHYGVFVDGSAGTIDKNTVYFPTETISSTLVGYQISNATGPSSLTNSTATGGAMPFFYGASIATAPTSAPITIANDTFQSTVNQGAYGVYIGGVASFVMTDCSVTIHGTQTNNSGSYRSVALYVDSGAAGRIERNRFVNNTTWNTSAVAGGYFYDGSQTEVYDNWFVGGTSASAGMPSAGIQLDGPGQSFAAQIVAIGNTLYGGGKVGAAGPSAGLTWGNDSTMSFVSNLIDAGISPQHTIMMGGNFNPGGVIGNFHQNYLQTSSSTAANTSSAPFASLAAGMTDANGNIMGGNTSCFDPLKTQPDYHLAANGPCIDKGVAGARKDTTAISQDVDKMPRVVGAGADIGCSEKM